jgi:nitroimidazol reductase NimA-like FMN-containing flavoprotein (pyridoxamine 5'-phosphate oxidase superfamily)
VNQDIVTDLTLEECWDLLRAQQLGRLAFHLAEQVHITPVNYAVDGETLLFRTGEGSKLLAVLMNDDVAFEIDEHNESWAWSVVLRGRAELLDEHTAHRADEVPLHTWISTPKYNVVRITPTEISGRRFVLDRLAPQVWLE